MTQNEDKSSVTNTGGGAAIGRDVNTGGGNFAGRDINIYEAKKECRDEQYRLVLNSSRRLPSSLPSWIKPTFREFDLAGRNLSGLNLSKADLQGANLNQASLRGTNLKGANLQAAQLEVADLREAKLEGANLKDAKLRGVKLESARYDANTIWPQDFTLPPANFVWSLQSALFSPSRPVEYVLSALFWGFILIYIWYPRDLDKFWAQLSTNRCMTSAQIGDKLKLSWTEDKAFTVVSDNLEFLPTNRSSDGKMIYGIMGDSKYWVNMSTVECNFDVSILPTREVPDTLLDKWSVPAHR